MRKLLLMILVVLLVLQEISFAESKFIYGIAPEIEETYVMDLDLKAKIIRVDGIPYIYDKFGISNPVPYDESLKRIMEKEYIITDDYYIAYDNRNEGAIAANAYIPFTTLLIYDKQLNLIHEEDFGGGVCIRDAGFCNGVFYCTYSEKLVEVTDETGTHDVRSYNEAINRNNHSEKIMHTTVKSTDMLNWEECNERIPISNTRACLFNGQISLFEQVPVSVEYESNREYVNNIEYEYARAYKKVGDWFVIFEYLENGGIYNIYLSNDLIYFVQLDIPLEAHEAFEANSARNCNIYEYSDNIIINFPYLKYYLEIPTTDVYNRLNELRETPYIRIKGEILGFDNPPVIEDGSTLVPMRFLFEQMGADVDWNGATRTATATLDDTAVTFSIDNTQATVNKAPAKMAVPARLIDDKTMVPLRFLSEELGFTVTWDADTRTAIIE